MTKAAERLAAAIHLESAAIAPQTSPLIEAAKEALAEIERMQAALRRIADDVAPEAKLGRPMETEIAKIISEALGAY